MPGTSNGILGIIEFWTPLILLKILERTSKTKILKILINPHRGIRKIGTTNNIKELIYRFLGNEYCTWIEL